jgi:hypothetical protein
MAARSKTGQRLVELAQRLAGLEPPFNDLAAMITQGQVLILSNLFEDLAGMKPGANKNRIVAGTIKLCNSMMHVRLAEKDLHSDAEDEPLLLEVIADEVHITRDKEGRRVG